jgi:hypothetical protein
MSMSGRTRIRRLASRLLTVGVGVGVLAGGCSNSGSYTLSWRFADTFQTGDCGRVGVTGIGIAATRSDGAQSSIAVPCGLGFYDGSLDAGSWTLALVALDATGNPKEPLSTGTNLLRGQTASPVEIHTGEQAADIPSVLLPPLPQCRDGVDNDLDGRVDLDDLDCARDPLGGNRLSECGASDGASCYDNPPGAISP